MSDVRRMVVRVPMRDGVHLATDVYLPARDGVALRDLLVRHLQAKLQVVLETMNKPVREE